MVLPIVAYGDPVLKEETVDLAPGHEGLEQLISDMWSTMYNAEGVGLAAPQVGHSIRLFVVDTMHIKDKEQEGLKKVFINATMLEEQGQPWSYEEG
jgi:peptide deformylase